MTLALGLLHRVVPTFFHSVLEKSVGLYYQSNRPCQTQY